MQNMILDRVVNAHLMQNYTAKIRAWIITSSGTGTVGYNLIRELFESNDVLARIISFAYSAGSAFAGFESGPIDRAVVEIAPKSHEGGGYVRGIMKLYMGSFNTMRVAFTVC